MCTFDPGYSSQNKFDIFEGKPKMILIEDQMKSLTQPLNFNLWCCKVYRL